MKLHPSRSPLWNPLFLDPSTLSDEQVEYFYQLALKECIGVEQYPKATMGRYTVASTYLRLVQADRKRKIKESQPQV